MKVEKGGVHYKKYNGHYTKQLVRISKVIYTSPIIIRRFTCRTSFNKAFFMKRQAHLWVLPLGTSHLDFHGPIEL
jgi:hypothetical protein